MRNRNEKRVMNAMELIKGKQFLVNDYKFGTDHNIPVGTMVTIEQPLATGGYVRPVNSSKPNKKRFWTRIHMYQLNLIK